MFSLDVRRVCLCAREAECVGRSTACCRCDSASLCSLVCSAVIYLPHPACLPACPPPPLPAAYEFEEEKAGEEGDADLAKVEQLKALMGEQWAVSYGT